MQRKREVLLGQLFAAAGGSEPVDSQSKRADLSENHDTVMTLSVTE